MKRQIVIVLIVLALTSLACSVSVNAPDIHVPNINVPNVGKVGPTQTFTVNEPLPAANGPANITLEMGAGELNLSGGATGLLEGTVSYNIQEWKPTLNRQGDTIVLKQEPIKSIPFNSDTENTWNLKLNGAAPMDLTLHAGAYKAEMDLSGLSLTSLDVQDGASDARVEFNSPNPQTMSRLSYKTGASKVELVGLANANFTDMTFESGAGDYTLDFSGQLQQDATVSVNSGVSQVTIIIPAGMHARVTNTGSLSNVELQGNWNSNGSIYETTGSGPTLTIDVSMGVGNLKLVQQ